MHACIYLSQQIRTWMHACMHIVSTCSAPATISAALAVLLLTSTTCCVFLGFVLLLVQFSLAALGVLLLSMSQEPAACCATLLRNVVALVILGRYWVVWNQLSVSLAAGDKSGLSPSQSLQTNINNNDCNNDNNNNPASRRLIIIIRPLTILVFVNKYQ